MRTPLSVLIFQDTRMPHSICYPILGNVHAAFNFAISGDAHVAFNFAISGGAHATFNFAISGDAHAA